MRVVARAWGGTALLVVAALALVGCSGFGIGTSTVKLQVQALRTTSDGQGLVASYLGGSCDRSASLAVHEHSDEVDVAVQTKVDSSGACDAAGHPRTVSATLAAPLGTRTARDDARTLTVFDGSRLRRPAPLPAGLGLLSEQGEENGPGSWTLTYGRTLPATGPCAGGPGLLTVIEAPTGTDIAGGLATAGVRRFGAVTASLYGGGTGAAASWTLVWPAYGGEIALRSQAVCDGDHPLDGDDLVALAQTLQPL